MSRTKARTQTKKQKAKPSKAKQEQSKGSKIAHPWDFWMKALTMQEGQAVVSFLLPGAQFLGTRDKELEARTVEADLLLHVIWHGIEVISLLQVTDRKDAYH